MESIKEKTILDLLISVWDNKLFIICFSFIFMAVFVILTPKKTDIKKDVQSISLIRKPPNLIFVNFVNTYASFFSDNSLLSPNESAEIESTEFYDSFKLKIISIDNFINFFAETKNSSSIDNARKDYLQNKFGFLDKKILTQRSKGTNSEAVFFIHKSNVKGSDILNEFILYCFNQALDDYKINKLKQFSIVLGQYEKAKMIAKEINLKNPFYLDSEINFKNQQISSFFNNSKLYFRGYLILQLEIDEMKSKIDFLKKNGTDDIIYNPIIDTAYEVISEKVTKTLVSNYVKGLIIGFLTSLIIIYFKPLLIKRRKSHSK